MMTSIGMGKAGGCRLLPAIAASPRADADIRLETLSKEKGAQIVMMAGVTKHAGCHDALAEA